MNEILKILLVEDSSYDIKLLTNLINKHLNAELRVVETEGDYRKELDSFNPDIVLSDYNLPAFDGMKALQIAKELHPHIPFVLVTGSINEETAVESIKSGADDYILKENLNRLLPAIISAVEKRANIKAKENAEEKLRILSLSVEQSPVSVIITNAAGNIEFVNPKFCEVTGYTEEEVLGKNPRILNSGFTPRESYIQLWENLLAGKPWMGEFHNKKKNGELFWERAAISPLIKNGSITHFVAVKEDITERKKMLEELIASKERAEEHSRLKSNFIANVSHELRTPLVGLLGIAEFLKMELEGKNKEDIEIIYKSGVRLLKTITEILNFSKLETEKPKIDYTIVDIEKVIKDELEIHRHSASEKGIYLRQTTFNEPLHIVTDEKLLREIIYSILNNAIKFTLKGNISVSVDKTEDDIVIRIKDTGIGIDQEKIELIFDDFRQASEGMGRVFEGIGIGLSISRRYTELLGGKITVESTPGTGSTFSVHLPKKNKAVISKDKTPVGLENLSEASKDYKVLIVEDDFINALTIKKMLEKKYKVFQAHTGPVAIDITRKEDIDVILMDINLKHSINGMETTQIIRRIKGYETKPIIAMTAYAMPSDREQFIEAGCSHYIAKPFAMEDLLILLNEVTEGKISLD